MWTRNFGAVAVTFPLLLVLSHGLENGFTVKRGQSFVVSKSDKYQRVLSRSKRHVLETSIARLHVTSVIVSRFARVTFESKVENAKDVPAEKVFSVRLPSAAFITEFNMTVEGVTFIGKVKEKEAAKEQYHQAVESGNVAGLVVAEVRETQTFSVSAHVPAHSSVTFHLVYQQLLNRKLGQYEHAIIVNPRQLVDDFLVNVYITETSGIKLLTTGVSENALPRNKIRPGHGGEIHINTEIRRSEKQAFVSFKPLPMQQRRFLMLPEDQQKFVVRYDVKREVLGGEIQTRNGYFVHFFAPDNLPILPKKVIFVIDRSGSMSGRKIEQTKTAFASIIKELRRTDQFDLVTFSSGVRTWKSEVVDANEENVREAEEYVRRISADGLTNLDSAIQKASQLLDGASQNETSSSMIILLTDGMPTTGIQNTAQIRLNSKRTISGRFSLFCLGFGNDVDQDFLKRLANENDGIARKIYEDSDVELQLENFFQEVATPLLIHVKMNYTGVNLTEISKTKFDKFFKGSEIIVVGSYNNENQLNTKIQSTILGKSVRTNVAYDIESSKIDDNFQHWFTDTGDFDDFIERLWAYFTIRDLLEKRILTDDRIEIQRINNRILRLALKYGFVTPLTSMVVTLPKDEITTTTTGPTMESTIPPCFVRGSDVPTYIRFPIWCPLIIDPDVFPVSEANRPPQRPGIGSRRGQGGVGQPGQPIQPSQRGMAMLIPSFRRVQPSQPGPRLTQRTHLLFGAGSSSGRHWTFGFSRQGATRPRLHALPLPSRRLPPRPRPTQTRPTRPRRPTPRPRPQIWEQCSGILNKSSGKIELPNDDGPHEIFLCRWMISLPEGKFIDLFVETANTTRNEVEVKSEGLTVYKHTGGNSPSKYIFMENNNVTIVYKIYRGDSLRPGIVISYREFSYNNEGLEATADTPTILDPPLSGVSCGETIPSSANMNGSIVSPAYPEAYPDKIHCEWNIVNEVSETHELKLSFIHMDIEWTVGKGCRNDKLVVEYGDKKKIICGQQVPDNIVSKFNITMITFSSDEAFGANGFKMRYEFITKE